MRREDILGYGSWANMKARCSGKSSAKNNKYYYMRNIKVCERWAEKKEGFLNFLEDMGVPPTKKHSIDRIDNNGNYEPSNCRWATHKEQCNNTNRIIKQGKKMEKKKGDHVTEMVPAQATIPKRIFEAVKKHADYEGFNMSTYFRKWIIEGYKRDMDGIK